MTRAQLPLFPPRAARYTARVWRGEYPDGERWAVVIYARDGVRVRTVETYGSKEMGR